ncbi:MAG: hypothetical protein ABEH66_06230 [Halobacteriales archaeon]
MPALDPGLQLLDADPEASHALHAVAVDHVLSAGGDACWIDPGHHARTAPLVDVAPSDRILDRVRVARGFTAFQHLALLESLPDLLTDRTALIVVPDVDGYYRDDDLLATEGQEMLLTGLASLAQVARTADIPVVLTRREDDSFSAPVANAATRTIRCEATRLGPRFRTDDAESDETLVYPVAESGLVQTTLAFWKRVLTARHPQAGPTREVTARGAD